MTPTQAALGGFGSSIDGTALGPSAVGAGLGLVDDVAYSETSHRGYLMMTVTSDAVKGEYVFVDTIKSTAYTASTGRTVTVSASGSLAFA